MLNEWLPSTAPAWAWASTAAQAFPLRVAVALLVLPLLYRALGESGSGWGGARPAEIARRGFFSLLGALIFFSLTANWVPEERAPTQGRGFEAFVKGIYSYRLSFTPFGDAAAERGRSPRETAVDDFQKAVDLLPESAFFRRALGIARAERGQYTVALRELEQAMSRLEERAPERAREERALWRRLYGPKAPAAPELEAARKQVEGYGLGWMGRVAVLAAYQRLGEKAVPAELRSMVEDEAGRYFQGVLSGALVSLLLIPQWGLISLIVGAVLVATGIVRAARRDQQPVGAPLWESFILMMALGMLPVLWMFGGKRPAPETQPGLFAGLLLIRDLAQILAVVYLAWRLRRRGLNLKEIGFTMEGFWPNVLVGVMAATVLIPTGYLINLATQALSQRYFPNVAPPYHPLQGLTATSGSLEIRVALFLAAAVGAPLLEEIFFRGALFGALRRRFGFWPGLLGSSAFFAILHPQLPLGFLPIAMLGGAFAALYEWRQSLIPGIVAHAVNNGLAFLMISLLFPPRG